MTEYLTAYMELTEKRLSECKDLAGIEEILAEHKDKIAFMQHERIVHFLVTMMFALILTIFMCAFLFSDNMKLLVLVTMIIVLLAFYIKHYYFLENTVQKMYKVYDRMLEMKREMQGKAVSVR
ncbi:MAG: hypothetical protein IKQ90_00860 [Ruminococcus sp.]|nr:hypothetical protein [Ruminococcus sp.]